MVLFIYYTSVIEFQNRQEHIIWKICKIQFKGLDKRLYNFKLQFRKMAHVISAVFKHGQTAHISSTIQADQVLDVFNGSYNWTS